MGLCRYQKRQIDRILRSDPGFKGLEKLCFLRHFLSVFRRKLDCWIESSLRSSEDRANDGDDAYHISGILEFRPFHRAERKTDRQVCKLEFRLKELTSCSCSTAALPACLEGRMAGVDTTETGN